MKRFLLCLVFCTITQHTLHAEMVRVDFLGELNSVIVSPGAVPRYSVGDSFFGHIFFNPGLATSSGEEYGGLKTYSFAPEAGGLVLWMNNDVIHSNGLEVLSHIDPAGSGKRTVTFSGMGKDGVSLFGVSFHGFVDPAHTNGVPGGDELLALGKANLGGMFVQFNDEGLPHSMNVVGGEVLALIEVPTGNDGGSGNPPPDSTPEPSETPEPASALLMLLGAAGILGRRLARGHVSRRATEKCHSTSID